MSIFTKLCPEGVELMRAEKQTDGRMDTAKRIGNILRLTKMRLEIGSFFFTSYYG